MAEFDKKSTQLDLSGRIRQRIQLVQRIFDPADLHKNGLETEPHVTVLYGLDDSVTSEQVAEVARKFRGIGLKFGDVSLFERDDFDVVKVEVESPELRELRARLEKLPNSNEWQTYQPHVTIAYVKPGLGAKYLINPLAGQEDKVRVLTLSGKDGEKKLIPLMPHNTEAKAASATPTASYGHGPGGLFSMAGLSADHEKRLKAIAEKADRYTRDNIGRFSGSGGGGGMGGKSPLMKPLRAGGSISKSSAMAKIKTAYAGKEGLLKNRKITRPKSGRYTWVLSDGNNNPIARSASGGLSVTLLDKWIGESYKGLSADHEKRLKAIVEKAEVCPICGAPADTVVPGRRLRMCRRCAQRLSAMTTPVLSATTGMTSVKGNSFQVFKDKSGDNRWVAISSNAYRDRDGEIVSQKSLEADVERADKTGEYGNLRMWHVPTTDLGKCDFNMMRGKMLIESGTFKTKEIGAAIAKAAPNLQMSIGFAHPKNEPDADGVFYNIRRFERSLVPKGRAANPFTSLSVKENRMNDQQKITQFKALLQDPGVVDAFINGADTTEKAADGQGFAYKSNDDLSAMTPDALLEYALSQKEAELEKAKKAEVAAPEKEDGSLVEMKAMMTEMKGMMGEMKKMFPPKAAAEPAKTEKSVDATEAHNERFTALEGQIAGLVAQLGVATKELTSIKADQPTAVAEGVRPTQAADNLADGGQVEANKEAATPSDSFFDFLSAVPQGNSSATPG